MTTQFGVLVCQSTILLLKAVQKRSKKIKKQKSKYKISVVKLLTNSWFLKHNGPNSSFKSTSSSKNQKVPSLAGNGSSSLKK